jgi:hypothetical protein
MGTLEVKNSIVLYRDAKLAQIGFEESGMLTVYQASSSSAGRDGVGK